MIYREKEFKNRLKEMCKEIKSDLKMHKLSLQEKGVDKVVEEVIEYLAKPNSGVYSDFPNWLMDLLIVIRQA